jgi:hypothetical protein
MISPLYRSDAPITSIEAAESIDTVGLEALVVDTLRGHPAGLISDEVRAQHPGLAYSSITARYASLYRKGVIQFPGQKRPGKSGRGQRVMVLVDQKPSNAPQEGSKP